MAVWNRSHETPGKGVRVVPPSHCLKNRVPAGSESPVPVQRQPAGNGPLKPAEHVLFGTFEGSLIVGNLRTEMSFCLTGAAADMWHALVETGHPKEALLALKDAYKVDDATLGSDLHAFVDDLRNSGLLKVETNDEAPAL